MTNSHSPEITNEKLRYTVESLITMRKDSLARLLDIPPDRSMTNPSNPTVDHALMVCHFARQLGADYATQLAALFYRAGANATPNDKPLPLYIKITNSLHQFSQLNGRIPEGTRRTCLQLITSTYTQTSDDIELCPENVKILYDAMTLTQHRCLQDKSKATPLLQHRGLHSVEAKRQYLQLMQLITN